MPNSLVSHADEKNRHARLIVLSAPSGAGKTTLARKVIATLQAQGFKAGFSVSYTTRAPRPGEQDGRDYHFVTREQFEGMVEAGQMLEHAEVFGRLYGTGLAATQAALKDGEIVFLDIDWQGARQIKLQLEDACQRVFILPPSRAVLLARLQGRGQDSAEVIAGRMDAAVAEMSHYSEFDYVLVNDDLEQAAQDLLDICLGLQPPACLASDHAALIKELLAP